MGKSSLKSFEFALMRLAFKGKSSWENRKRKRLKQSQKLGWVNSRNHKSVHSFYLLSKKISVMKENQTFMLEICTATHEQFLWVNAQLSSCMRGCCWLRVSDCKQRAVYVHRRRMAYKYPTVKEKRSGQVNQMDKTLFV